eukprot:TRINITY_DN61997_c0_g1_i1.p1 TRINITY_DN61997_c0_g1~~TRINITY_DN61997_c0_g1_i1.p1  ORF type:complete len:362 (+),score=64.79 TRINITY_DN61997_c0_g1_i1:180-1265(+)
MGFRDLQFAAVACLWLSKAIALHVAVLHDPEPNENDPVLRAIADLLMDPGKEGRGRLPVQPQLPSRLSEVASPSRSMLETSVVEPNMQTARGPAPSLVREAASAAPPSIAKTTVLSTGTTLPSMSTSLQSTDATFSSASTTVRPTEKLLKKVFGSIDLDGDGMVSPGELSKFRGKLSRVVEISRGDPAISVSPCNDGEAAATMARNELQRIRVLSEYVRYQKERVQMRAEELLTEAESLARDEESAWAEERVGQEKKRASEIKFKMRALLGKRMKINAEKARCDQREQTALAHVKASLCPKVRDVIRSKVQGVISRTRLCKLKSPCQVAKLQAMVVNDSMNEMAQAEHDAVQKEVQKACPT